MTEQMNNHISHEHDAFLSEETGIELDEPYEGASFETYRASTRQIMSTRTLFSKSGQLSKEAKKHTAFVAEVISSIAETCIFAYLGAFLFSSNYKWFFKLNLTGTFCCILSRGIMIFFISFITNCLESRGMRRLFRKCSRSTDEEFSHRTNGIQINCKMQLALIFAGLRGAVSLALVQSIPLYNTMTKTGTHYKAELKTMTSTAIILTVFVFGGSTRKFLSALGFVEDDKNKMIPDRPLLQNA